MLVPVDAWVGLFLPHHHTSCPLGAACYSSAATPTGTAPQINLCHRHTATHTHNQGHTHSTHTGHGTPDNCGTEQFSAKQSHAIHANCAAVVAEGSREHPSNPPTSNRHPTHASLVHEGTFEFIIIGAFKHGWREGGPRRLPRQLTVSLSHTHTLSLYHSLKCSLSLSVSVTVTLSLTDSFYTQYATTGIQPRVRSPQPHQSPQTESPISFSFPTKVASQPATRPSQSSLHGARLPFPLALVPQQPQVDHHYPLTLLSSFPPLLLVSSSSIVVSVSLTRSGGCGVVCSLCWWGGV